MNNPSTFSRTNSSRTNSSRTNSSRTNSSRTITGLLLAAVALASCSKEEAGDGAGPGKIEPIPTVEVERAKKACDVYAERICACAKTNPDLSSKCDLAKASPGALQMNLDLLASEGLEIAEQKAVKVEARKIAAACFQADSKLDLALCPRQ